MTATLIAGHPFTYAGPCYQCKTPLTLPTPLYDAATHSSQVTVYCPYGHPQHFPDGPTEAQILRAQLKQAQDDIALWREHCAAERKDHAATKRKLTTATNRARAGMCTFCRRTFANYARHMQTKHPADHQA